MTSRKGRAKRAAQVQNVAPVVSKYDYKSVLKEDGDDLRKWKDMSKQITTKPKTREDYLDPKYKFSEGREITRVSQNKTQFMPLTYY